MASLTIQLAQETQCLHFLKLPLQAGHHAHWALGIPCVYFLRLGLQVGHYLYLVLGVPCLHCLRLGLQAGYHATLGSEDLICPLSEAGIAGWSPCPLGSGNLI